MHPWNFDGLNLIFDAITLYYQSQNARRAHYGPGQTWQVCSNTTEYVKQLKHQI